MDTPKPVPGPGQVLVRAHSIGVSMPEILVRRGEYAWMPPLPAIPGIEMSGVVEALGEGVTSLRVGQPVFVSARELPVRGGCYAEYLAANADALYLLPQGTDLGAAAAGRSCPGARADRERTGAGQAAPEAVTWRMQGNNLPF
jgi:NADPH2:quinone reductase